MSSAGQGADVVKYMWRVVDPGDVARRNHDARAVAAAAGKAPPANDGRCPADAFDKVMAARKIWEVKQRKLAEVAAAEAAAEAARQQLGARRASDLGDGGGGGGGSDGGSDGGGGGGDGGKQTI